MYIDELKDYFDLCLNNIFNNVSFDYDFNKLSELKKYMVNNPNDPKVVEIKRKLCETIYYLYNNPNLYNSLNMPNRLKYGRQLKLIEIVKSDLYLNFSLLFRLVVFTPSGIKMDDLYNWFLEDNGFNTLNVFDGISNSGVNNICLSKSKYNSIDLEMCYHNLANQGCFLHDDYISFIDEKESKANSFNSSYDGDSRMDYINKKVGNIGELHWFNHLKKMDGRTILAARDFGDGLGYDIYGITNQDGVEKELLIEVKSTTNPNKDYFQLSDNEYDFMQSILSDPDAEYLLATAFIDVSNNYNIIRNAYMLNGNDKLYSLKGNDEYLLDSSSQKKLFKRR